MTPRHTRVLVVEDSLTVRRRLVEALSADPDLEVVGEAADGARGIELVRVLQPDVVTMDIMMPGVTGLAATEHIMAHHPTPILIVSGARGQREARIAFDALAAGAVDVFDKPEAHEPEDDWAARLRAAVKMTARIHVIRHIRARVASRRARREGREHLDGDGAQRRVIAIGGSTGAPAAVAALLGRLPRGFPIPILLVIHVSPIFSASLCEWLASHSALPVRPAVDGEPIPSGGVLTAPPDLHLLVAAGRVRLSDAPERHSCRPSVDVLFESVAREIGDGALGCLLTGMGTDGAEGLLTMRRAGAETIAQDEATSRIYGMPREAAERGAAARVLSLDRIAATLVAAALPDGARSREI